MIFSGPVPFAEAIAAAAGKGLLPTSLDSNGIRQLAREVREKSLLSARNTHEGILSTIRTQIDGLLKGEFNEATARATIQDALDAVGYTPEAGFSDAEPGAIPPAARGTLRDLSSDERVRLVLDTNMAQAQNYGFKLQGMDPDALWQYPAFELVREEVREVPRGEMPGTQGWPERFVRAGGRLVDGRMIALKSDPIWENLGNSELFSDGLDSSFPPYAFNSGMGWREVPRAEAIELGLLLPGESSDPAADQTFFTPEDEENLAGFAPGELRDLVAAMA